MVKHLSADMRTILHADMDAFFAAVEMRENPALERQPVVVGADPRGGRGRGVVSACNYEAREYGIHSAMPISEAYRRCPGAAFLPVRGELYGQVSKNIMEVFESYTELIEKLSIDEAFLDVTASQRLFGDAVTIARRIKREILQQQKLTVSIGVAPNKFLAKMASDLEKPDGLVVVEPGREKEFLHRLPVSRLWGVGAKTESRLRELGILKIGDIAATPLDWLERNFGSAHAHHLHQLANGVDDRPVVPDHNRKQIGKETTFAADTDDREHVRTILLGLTEHVAAALRHKGVAARTITLKLRLAPFETRTRRRTLDRSLTTTEAIYPIALRLLEAADPGDRQIRLIGISASGLHANSPERQLRLFDDVDDDESGKRVADVMDRLTKRFGKGTVRRGKLLKPEAPEDRV